MRQRKRKIKIEREQDREIYRKEQVRDREIERDREGAGQREREAHFYSLLVPVQSFFSAVNMKVMCVNIDKLAPNSEMKGSTANDKVVTPQFTIYEGFM